MTTATTSTTVDLEEKNGTRVECPWPTMDVVEDAARKAKEAMREARHTAEDLTARTEDAVRRHPIATIGAALSVGAAFGCLFGLGVGWAARSKR
jgi:ElaB/YqjD/DUF883 family membrane-anchored ribosome-binding protein